MNYHSIDQRMIEFVEEYLEKRKIWLKWPALSWGSDSEFDSSECEEGGCTC